MESLGNGWCVVGKVQRGSSVSKHRRRWIDRWLHASATTLLCLMLLASGVARAQTTHYVYDANGHVVAVTATNGTSVEYGYNPLGYPSQASTPIAAGQLATFAFMPTHGVAGTQVTIQGQGFDSHAANDTVSFNGVVASVNSASATQLVATVPNGATTGPIHVTVGSQTATSATSFVIDDTGAPPTITQVSPVITSVGTTVTVTGSHLDPVAGDTTVQMGGRDILSLSQVSDTQLQYVVPSNAFMGYVTVTTPYGSATSVTPVSLVPSGVNASSIVSSGVATVNGAGVNLNMGASGQMGAVLFTAPENEWVSLQASGITTSASSISYAVYGPGGSVVQQGAISAASPSIHLPHLVAGAMYLVLIQPSGGSAQMTLTVQSDATLAPGAPITLSTTLSGQSARLMFPSTGSAGISYEFSLSNITLTGGSGEVDVYTYDPAGNQINTTRCYTASPASCRDFVWGVTATGMQSLVVVPANGGVVSVNVTLRPPVAGPLLSTTTPSAAINLAQGQFEYLTFNATAGQPVTLNMANLSTTRSGQSAYVVIYSPTAGVITPTNFYTYFDANSRQTISVVNLPATGTYTVIVDTPLGVPMTGILRLVPTVIEPLAGGGTSGGLATTVPEQNAYMSFTANPGDSFELGLSNITGSEVDLNVYNASGGQIAGGNCYQSNPGSSCRVFLWGLAAGDYSIVATQPNGGTMSFNPSLNPPVMGPLLTPNTPTTVNLASGQYELLTFNATAGQTATLTMSGASTVPAGQAVFVVVYRPDVGTILPTNYYSYFQTTQTQSLTLSNLPVSGAYSIIVDSPYGLPLSGQLSVSVQ
ncbi:IPT/TIG domain [Burkholderia pseudomallei]|uniref:IPT/TIG domain-containing protein n=1 Tax=Burkholderia pseudomallei TaxID=28450 RepID=UPI0005DD0EBD|nr:IPT/TIG domain-containing protein [Burkholderia pseudomallei]TPB79304.1 glutamate synthase [Burkholderia pseudomallei]CAK0042263.1 IPT/TIG domain [Burkholderia pseudomallei]CFB52760.1 IPT/TIG domain [Burkholderia pseudomallei]CFD93178.1 IPT/TIG domain [Burkholderia pseudomallei]CFK82940.1 IPT/TIG domain [Burkholderia pseudomallei]